jgi:hypothetical protein
MKLVLLSNYCEHKEISVILKEISIQLLAISLQLRHNIATITSKKILTHCQERFFYHFFNLKAESRQLIFHRKHVFTS